MKQSLKIVNALALAGFLAVTFTADGAHAADTKRLIKQMGVTAKKATFVDNLRRPMPLRTFISTDFVTASSGREAAVYTGLTSGLNLSHQEALKIIAATRQ